MESPPSKKNRRGAGDKPDEAVAGYGAGAGSSRSPSSNRARGGGRGRGRTATKQTPHATLILIHGIQRGGAGGAGGGGRGERRGGQSAGVREKLNTLPVRPARTRGE